MQFNEKMVASAMTGGPRGGGGGGGSVDILRVSHCPTLNKLKINATMSVINGIYDPLLYSL